MQVREIMSADVKCCTPQTTIQEAAQFMLACDCGAIPVVDPGDHTKAVGIVTDRDIVCRAVAEGKNAGETMVSECMSDELTTILPEADVQECCDIMEKAKLRRLLVADRNGDLCGIVAQADIALHLSRNTTAELVKEVSEPTEEASAFR